MADVTSLDGISAVPHTAGQIQAIVNKIEILIYNIAAGGKWDAAAYKELGLTGHEFDPEGAMRQLRKWHKHLVQMLQEMPAEFYTQWDDPSV